MFAGGDSPELRRELLRQGHVAAVLLYDPVADTVVMVEQFRVGKIPHEPQQPWMVELVAGYLEGDERPEDVARRECLEEAGCVIDRLYPIRSYYVTPGVSSEMMHLFWAPVDSRSVHGIHGLPNEGEDIRVHVWPWDEVSAMLDDGRIDSATPVIALMWLRENRPRIRNEFGKRLQDD